MVTSPSESTQQQIPAQELLHEENDKDMDTGELQRSVSADVGDKNVVSVAVASQIKIINEDSPVTTMETAKTKADLERKLQDHLEERLEEVAEKARIEAQIAVRAEM